MAVAPYVIQPALVAIANNYAGINRASRGYIADQVAPRIRVDNRLFRWWQSDLADAFTQYDNQMSRMSQANEIGLHWTETTGQTLDWGLREAIPYGDEASAMAQSIPFSLKSQAVKNIVDKNQLAREVRVAALAMTMANYTTGYYTDLTSGTKWSDYTNSDPLGLVIDAMAGMILPGTIAVTSRKVANILIRHPAISKAAGGTLEQGRYSSLDTIASLMGLQKILVGNTLKQTSKRGQTLVTAQIWPDSFAIMFQGATGADGLLEDIKSPNFLTTFQWGDTVASEKQIDPGDMGVWGGVKVFTGESLVEKQVAPYAGYLFNAVL